MSWTYCENCSQSVVERTSLSQCKARRRPAHAAINYQTTEGNDLSYRVCAMPIGNSLIYNEHNEMNSGASITVRRPPQETTPRATCLLFTRLM